MIEATMDLKIENSLFISTHRNLRYDCFPANLLNIEYRVGEKYSKPNIQSVMKQRENNITQVPSKSLTLVTSKT